MNTRNVLLVLLVIGSLSGFSQKRRNRSYGRGNSVSVEGFGVFVGFGVSKFSSRVGPYADGQMDDYDNTAWLGLNTGFLVKSRLKDNFSLHLEASYNSKGGTASTSNPDVIVIGQNGTSSGKIYRSFRLNYLEFPILIGRKFYFAGVDNYADLGFAPQILASQNFVESQDGTSGSEKTEIDLANSFNGSFIFNYNLITDTKVPVLFVIRFFYSPFSPFKNDEEDGFNYKTATFGGTFGIGLLFNNSR